MSPPSLNEDVLALIVKEVALQAEESAPAAPVRHPRPTKEQWRRRSEALRGLALVSQIFRPLAQAELAHFVYIDKNYLHVAHAPRLDLRMARRVVLAPPMRVDPTAMIGLLEQCEGMEELLVSGGRVSLCSIARPSHQGESVTRFPRSRTRRIADRSALPQRFASSLCARPRRTEPHLRRPLTSISPSWSSIRQATSAPTTGVSSALLARQRYDTSG
jgi:hypothetical protein